MGSTRQLKSGRFQIDEDVFAYYFYQPQRHRDAEKRFLKRHGINVEVNPTSRILCVSVPLWFNHFLNARKNRVEHRLGQFSCEGVLLAGMIGSHQAQIRVEHDFSTVTEARTRLHPSVMQLPRAIESRIETDFAQT